MAEQVDTRVQHIRRVCDRMVLDLGTTFTNMRKAWAVLTDEVQFVHQLPPVPKGSSPVGLLPPIALNAEQVKSLASQLAQFRAREPPRVYVIREWTWHFNNADDFDLRVTWLTLKRLMRVMAEEVDVVSHCIAPHWEQVAGVEDYMVQVEKTKVSFEGLVRAWGGWAESKVLSHVDECVCVDTCGLVPGRVMAAGEHTHPNVLPFV